MRTNCSCNGRPLGTPKCSECREEIEREALGPLDAATCSAVDCSRIDDNGCDSCVAYQMANEQLRADVMRLVVDRNRITELVAKWRDMPSEEMRLRAGDMTVQEIRSVKAVLTAILPNAYSAETSHHNCARET